MAAPAALSCCRQSDQVRWAVQQSRGQRRREVGVKLFGARADLLGLRFRYE